jgi:hypothetical protein
VFGWEAYEFRPAFCRPSSAPEISANETEKKTTTTKSPIAANSGVGEETTGSNTPLKSTGNEAWKDVKKNKSIEVIYLHSNIPKDILNDMKQLASIIEEAKPQASISDLKVRKSGEIIIFPCTYADYARLSKKENWKATRFGNLIPSPPTAKTVPQTVVAKEVPLEVEVDAIVGVLKERDIHPTAAVRMKRASDGAETKSIKITLTSQTQKDDLTKNGIQIFYRRIRCEEYKSPPSVLQCFRCQEYRHGLGQCQAQSQSCMRCGDAHWKSACIVEAKNAICKHCKGNYPASFKGCKFYKEALEKFGPRNPSIRGTRSAPSNVTAKSQYPVLPQNPHLTSGNPPLSLIMTTVADALEKILNNIGLTRKVEFSLISQCVSLSCREIMGQVIPSQNMANIRNIRNGRIIEKDIDPGPSLLSGNESRDIGNPDFATTLYTELTDPKMILGGKTTTGDPVPQLMSFTESFSDKVKHRAKQLPLLQSLFSPLLSISLLWQLVLKQQAVG